ncbi:MAG: TetR/AcrR family transcriptional regulator [Clostridiales Family XIII bacterium]|jgi:AcrR family transcriptional regulator|nr:TetR/AcrR family transcriptional regulator [Clostridiales Family XIII bacterium]
MTRITKPVVERRQEIIDTAKALFIENGFDKTQVADISQKMVVAQGLIYYYFKSKTEILYAIIDEMVEEQYSSIEQSLSAVSGTAMEKLKILFRKRFNKDQYGKLIPSIMNDVAISEYCSNKMTESSMPHLLTLIMQGNEDGSWHCEYPKETALFITRGISGIMQLRAPEYSNESMEKALIDIFIRILGPPQK